MMLSSLFIYQIFVLLSLLGQQFAYVMDNVYILCYCMHVFCKNRPTGGTIKGQCEKGRVCSLWDQVGIFAQNLTAIASCVHDLRHFVKN